MNLCFTETIKGYPEYLICKDGRVISLARRGAGGRILVATLSHGYPTVLLYQQGKRKCIRVHRLMAEAFLPNPENKPDVNHKNGIRSDCRLENLEWATKSWNQEHSYKVLGRKPAWLGKTGNLNPGSKPVLQIENGNIIKRWDSIGDAAREGYNKEYIIAVCKGRHKQHKGYQWAYADIH